MKEESKKADSKLHIRKSRIMASGPITSWQKEGVKVKAVTDVLLDILGPKITMDDDCSHEIRR